MTKKLEDLLNMPDSKEIINDDKKKERVKQQLLSKKKLCVLWQSLIKLQLHSRKLKA